MNTWLEKVVGEVWKGFFGNLQTRGGQRGVGGNDGQCRASKHTSKETSTLGWLGPEERVIMELIVLLQANDFGMLDV